MLICNISARARQTLATEIAEIATAHDALATVTNVLKVLLDDPTAASDAVDAFLGEIIVEAASASDAFSAAQGLHVLFDAPAHAADSVDALFATVVSIAEAATASTTQDATITPATFTATWSPTDKLAVTLTGSNLIATTTAGTNNGVRGTSGHSSGKYYFELTANTWTTINDQVGLATATAAFNTATTTTGKAFVNGGGAVWVNAVSVGVGLGTISSGMVVGIAVDLSAHLIWFRVAPAGNWNASGTANPATGVGGISISALAGTLYPTFGGGSATGQVGTANFGASAFTGTPPSGFTAGWP